ncbi:MAG: histidine kinase [Microbacteriaceae bacterium]|nr:ECF transporter S component [Cryobacterium sp.]MBX3104086.1 ECF transporter S component [Cryobacterium sp.]MCC6376274.1 histidine kinase [Microbacteriaceae bacterium]
MSSTAVPADSKKVRNRIFIALGTIIIIATYLYLVVGQPTDIAKSSFSQAGLIAIAGYVIGAILLAVGAIHRLPTATVAMVPVAIALNIVVGQLVSVIGIPVYLDSIGTILVSALAGPAAGVVTGILTNVIWGLTLSPIALPYAVVQVVIGVMAGYAARIGVFRLFYLAPIAGAITGLVCAIVSAPISAFVFGGATGGGTGAIVGAFQAMGQSLLGATTLQGLMSDPLDKAITFTIVVLILAALPSRFRNRFPFVREYHVFGRKNQALPTLPAPAQKTADAVAADVADATDKK